MQCCPTLQPTQYQYQLQQLQLGLLDANGQFQPAPVSLTPWQLSTSLWQQALTLSQLLGRLMLAASTDVRWLKQAVQTLPPGSLFAELAALPEAFHRNLPAVPLMRHDLLLDNNSQWRWVESNTIAAGMGPLNQQLGRLLDSIHQPLADNPAVAQQAHTLYKAARALRSQYDSAPAVIVFVVEPAEDNLFDQLLLQQALQQLGARVLRSTLFELTQAQLDQHSRLQLTCGTAVDLLYYRTGYNLSDYASPEQLALRGSLQHARLLQCPDIPLQLAGSKWIQAKLSMMLLSGRDDTLSGWGFNTADCGLLRQAVMPMYALTAASQLRALRDINRGWLLKSQQEGGGGIWRGSEARQLVLSAPSTTAALLLMAPIDQYVRSEPVRLLRHSEISYQLATVSELGLFSVGTNNQYGGYLLRSKPATELAGGVHRGSAVLDTVALISQQPRNSCYKSEQVGYDNSATHHAYRKTHDYSIVRRPVGTDICCAKC